MALISKMFLFVFAIVLYGYGDRSDAVEVKLPKINRIETVRKTTVTNRTPALKKYEKEDLVQLHGVAILLKGGAPLTTFSASIRSGLRRIAGVTTDAELQKSENIDKIIKWIKTELGIDEHQVAVGKVISDLQKSLDPIVSVEEDREDIKRGYGWRLLKEDDPAFSDPRFLASMLGSVGMTGFVSGFSGSKIEIYNQFKSAWKDIAPENVRPPFQFTLTGTDANNALYDIADRVVQNKRRVGAIDKKSDKSAEILAFHGSFAGGKGRMLNLNFRVNGENPETSGMLLKAPTTTVWNPTNIEEINRLIPIENRVLDEIREKVQKNDPPIGGFLLESIQGANGVRFFRPEFLLRLRELCDELDIPIFADEILTGGGRTGKFFGYQNYVGFEPDFVTVGKGLQIAGVSKVKRSGREGYEVPGKITSTLTIYHEPILKSTAILRRIKEGELMENAVSIGNYLRSKLVSLYRKQLAIDYIKLQEKLRDGTIDTDKFEMEAENIRNELITSRTIRGLGVLNFYVKFFVKGAPDGKRILLPLSATKEDVDLLLNKVYSRLKDEVPADINFHENIEVNFEI